jgi:hypothetical protein
MTTMPDPTIQTPVAPSQAYPGPVEAQRPSEVRGSTSATGHHTEVRPEDPKRNPITYLALAIATLALLLSIVALTRDSGPDQIDVGGKRCIVDRIPGNDADTLFCQS